MVLVKEATMKPRTRTLGALGAAVVTTGLVLGLAFAGNSAASGTDRTTPADMSAMHSMMHQMMKGTVDDDVLAQCDQAHAAMAGSMTTAPTQGQSNHEAHHGGTGS